MPSTAVRTNCGEKEWIENAFTQNTIQGTSPITSLKFIGPMIQSNSQPLNISTINDLIQVAHNLHNLMDIDRMLETCTFNARKNTCVVQRGNNKPDYHVPDINVCGYNTLLATLQFARTHPNQFGFPQNIDLSTIRTLKPRERGKTVGSRYCSCIQDEQGCNLHGQNCEWKETLQVCAFKGNRRQDAGFKGKRQDGNTRRLSQKIGTSGTVIRQGEVYKAKQRQPTAYSNSQTQNQNPLPPPPPPPQSQTTTQTPTTTTQSTTQSTTITAPQTRSQTRPRRSERIRLRGGTNNLVPFTREELHIMDCEVFGLEACDPKLSRSLRQFRNFIHLTN